MADFQFTELFGDARMEELKLLSWADQNCVLTFNQVPSGAWHDMLVHLASTGLLSVFSYDWATKAHPREYLANTSGIPGESPLERTIASARIRAVFDLYEGRPPAELRLTHPGRIRLSELKQALRSGREREPFGILWEGRHFKQDLQIAILEAREDAPLAVAYLDMNGLKAVNEAHGHDGGDLALHAYFQAVSLAVGDRGQAYRLSGGADEVLLFMPNHDREAAVAVLRMACKALMNEHLEQKSGDIFLSVAVGLIICNNSSVAPASLQTSADIIQASAKVRSRKGDPRPSVIAIEGDDEMIVIEHATTKA